MSVRLDPSTGWLHDPAIARIFGALDGAGAGPRFVGGCVRDALLGVAVSDIDIATPLTPDIVTARLRQAGIAVHPTGIDHGTVTAVSEGRVVEVTTLRIDRETDGRHAKVVFTDDWQADAARRDFTMNALSAERDGAVHDYFGGVGDARAGRVRFIGDPVARIGEDALRILRFFRFHARFGRGEPDAAGLAACAGSRGMIAGLSGERIRNEILKLLATDDPVPAWRAMEAAGVAEAAIGEPGDTGRLAAMVRVDPTRDPVLRLAALLRRDPRPVVDRLRMSRSERERLTALATDPPLAAPEPRALRALVYREGKLRVADRLIMAAAEGREDGLAARLALVRDWPVPALPVRGRDAAPLGLSGPAIGEALRAVEAWWVAHDFAPDRAACLARLAEVAETAANRFGQT